jgi:DNA polymerase-3 subunit chi
MATKPDTPAEAWFYHLEHGSIDQVLPELLEKTLARGWRAMVRCTDPARLDHLDSWLWRYRDESFLAHGRAGQPHASRQPILLTEGEEPENGAQALFILDEPPGGLDAYARCIVLFEGADEVAVARARRLWSSYKAAGSSIAYWKQQETRGWTRQA